jgi:GNAT superfamily N-acetyltransferase
MELARIKQATTPEDLTSIARFRYRIYVEEMGRFQQYADHAEKTVYEPLDRRGHILMAVEDSNVVGTVRVNLGSEGDLGGYAELYRLRDLGPAFANRISITTKLMVAPEYRSTPLALKLALACYKYASARGVDIDAMDCNPPLRPFFAKLGYRQIFGAIDHPEYGYVIPMFLAVRDKCHLKRVGSPFYKLAQSLDHDQESADILNSLAELCRPVSIDSIGLNPVLKDVGMADCSQEVCPESENC